MKRQLTPRLQLTLMSDLYSLPTIRAEAGRRGMYYLVVTMLNSMGVPPGAPGFRSTVGRLVGTVDVESLRCGCGESVLVCI